MKSLSRIFNRIFFKAESNYFVFSEKYVIHKEKYKLDTQGFSHGKSLLVSTTEQESSVAVHHKSYLDSSCQDLTSTTTTDFFLLL